MVESVGKRFRVDRASLQVLSAAKWDTIRVSQAFSPGFVSGWLVALSIVHNDIRLSWEHMMNLSREADPWSAGDYVYFARLVSSHLFEAVKLVRLGLKRQETLALFGRIGRHGQSALKLVVRFSTPKIGWVDMYLKPIRDGFSHYRVDHIRSALAAVAKDEPELTSWYCYGRDWPGDRFYYADEIAVRLI